MHLTSTQLEDFTRHIPGFWCFSFLRLAWISICSIISRQLSPFAQNMPWGLGSDTKYALKSPDVEKSHWGMDQSPPGLSLAGRVTVCLSQCFINAK